MDVKRFLVAYYWKSGDKSGFSNSYLEPLGGEMTARAITGFELNIEKCHGHDQCTVMSFQEVANE